MMLIAWTTNMNVRRKLSLFLQSLFPGKVMTREEVASTIEAFIDGTGNEWDWDDFICVPLADQQLEKIRRKAQSIPGRFPSRRRNMWCSFEGLEELRKLSRRVRVEEE